MRGGRGRLLHDHVVERASSQCRREGRLHRGGPCPSAGQRHRCVLQAWQRRVLGHVVLDDGGNTGTITLNGGTGEFLHFRARASLTCSDAVNCSWDGTYRFGK